MEVMTAAEVANYLKVNRETIYRCARSGEIPHFKVSGKLLFRKTVIDEWIADQERREVVNLSGEIEQNLVKFRKRNVAL